MNARTVRAFVDAIEDATVRLILDGRSFDAPVSLLPEGAGEGTWIELRVSGASAPTDDAEELRRALGRGDPGGDIKL